MMATPVDDASIGELDDQDRLRVLREAWRRQRLLERSRAIDRYVEKPLADVLRDHALVHLPPAVAARLRLVHPTWARKVASPLFAIHHAAAPRRVSGLFAPSAGFIPFDGADAVREPPLAFLPADSSDLAVLSSSHGLACCFSPLDDVFFVCNPATGSWEAVPSPPRWTRPRPAVVLVFDASVYNFRGDYTLVCAFETPPKSGTYSFSVFTSGGGEWWFTDAIASAEGLVPSTGVAAGGTAWWRTAIGTVVGYNPVTRCVQLAVCPGDIDRWEIGSAGDRLHCAVRTYDGVAVFRLDVHGGWEAAAMVSAVDILNSWQPQVENREWIQNAGVRLLPFQGADLEVVVLKGNRVVAFNTATRRRREAAVQELEGVNWGAEVYTAHTNTLALVAPSALSGEPALLAEPSDDF